MGCFLLYYATTCIDNACRFNRIELCGDLVATLREHKLTICSFLKFEVCSWGSRHVVGKAHALTQTVAGEHRIVVIPCRQHRRALRTTQEPLCWLETTFRGAPSSIPIAVDGNSTSGSHCKVSSALFESGQCSTHAFVILILREVDRQPYQKSR